MPTKFTITSRLGLQKIDYYPPYVVISITDPKSAPAVLAKWRGRKAALRLEFLDLEFKRGTDIDKSTIQPCQAEEICRFAKEWHPKVEQIIVHCEAGISRSAGVACVLAELLEGSDPFSDMKDAEGLPLYFPNNLVMKEIRDAWHSIHGSTSGLFMTSKQ
jgi:predicted protein tyrosine phosphatase